ncbi:MAG: PQQ-dependent sugar dehydrogenase [Alphaproteobacteria bacterium]|nr:MAG: PQQ-dependent sugar dehydrogenase [Alphaproteobacteria bacterium]
MSHLSQKFLKAVAGISIVAGLALPPAQAGEYEATVVAEGLDFPWSLAFLPDGRMLVTERSGQLRYLEGGNLSTPIAGVPEPFVRSQGGLFDVVLHPNFSENQWIYLSYSAGTRQSNATTVVRARLTETGLADVTQIFQVDRKKDTPVHFGGRMAFLPDGTLLLTTGDGFEYREQAQNLSNHLGSTLRLNDDGSVPADNPFVGQAGAKPEIFTYGHRSPQGLTIDPETGTIYQTEHGPMGGDEVNILKAGHNYGWPVITFGLDYDGSQVTPYKEMEGMELPFVDWTPSIATSGIAVYRGDLFPDWNGDIFAGSLKFGGVYHVDVEDGVAGEEEILLEDLGYRIRDVRVGPDGALYVIGEALIADRYKSNSGKIWKLTPQPE